jgi:hydroxyacylglutathione hydrolase
VTVRLDPHRRVCHKASNAMKLEDEVGDVISKAQRGLGLATSTLADQSNLPLATVRGLRSGEWTPEALKAIAPALKLRPEGLLRLAKQRWQPGLLPPAELLQIDQPAPMRGYKTMRVNAFLVLPPGTRDAILFDTGTSLEPVLNLLGIRGRRLAAVFITHAHWDHCDALPALRQQFPEVPLFGPGDVPIAFDEVLKSGDRHFFGGVGIEARETPGHAPAALSYVVSGLNPGLVIVGDALFAGSIGGIPEPAYQSGLAAIRQELLSLPHDTVVGPGHGSLTSIGYERQHNPFFHGKDIFSE